MKGLDHLLWRKADRAWEPSAYRGRGLEEDVICLCCSVQWQNNRHWTQTGSFPQGFFLAIREALCYWGGWQHWHRLPRGCGVSSLKIIRSYVDVVLGRMLWVSLFEQGWGQMDPEAPSNLWLFLPRKLERSWLSSLFELHQLKLCFTEPQNGWKLNFFSLLFRERKKKVELMCKGRCLWAMRMW